MRQKKPKSGKVDVRYRDSTGKYRLRFYAVAPDHLNTISSALCVARQLGQTAFDSVALELICMQFLVTAAAHAPSTSEDSQ